MGWNVLAAGDVEALDIPATHQNLMHVRAVTLLAEHLETFLKNVREADSNNCATARFLVTTA